MEKKAKDHMRYFFFFKQFDNAEGLQLPLYEKPLITSTFLCYSVITGRFSFIKFTTDLKLAPTTYLCLQGNRILVGGLAHNRVHC